MAVFALRQCTMADLSWLQYALIGLIFVWSGFVRSGLGFGGAALSLPFLLLIVNDPLIFLPIIAIHLLIFSSLIAGKGFLAARRQTAGSSTGRDNVDWDYLKWSLKIMIVPKLIGVLGLLTLPPRIMSTIIFVIVIAYAIGYVLNKPIRSGGRKTDLALLGLGGYVSGSSLIGAPLIVAVYASHVAKHQLRDTLFILWFILVTIKMISFLIAGVDLQLAHQLWLLPCAWVGHIFGERFHQRIVAAENATFFRVVGATLILVSLIGIVSALR